MGTFNFSNMQGGQQQETQNIPREFRPAVEQAKTEPVGSYGNNKTGFWDGVKNFFSGADVDTSAGFSRSREGAWIEIRNMVGFSVLLTQITHSD